MKNPRLPNAALLALLAALAAGAATPLRAAPSAPDFDPKGAGGGRESLEWGGDLDSALALAKEAYAPVAIFFSSPGCAWCARMKRDVLTDPAAAEVLKHFVRVEIDISKDRAAAVRFQVTGSPALRILDAAGTTQAGADGYLGAADLRRTLSGALNAEFLRQADAAHAEAVDQLDANEVPAERWPELLTAFSDKAKRADLHPRILKLEPFPAAEFVDLLGNAKLAVRLGALDILEELAGGSFGFDPWLAPDDGGNAGALAAWKDWLSGGGGEQAEKRRFAALSEDSLAGFIRDLISEDRERAARALRMLEQGGGAALEGLGKFLGDNPEIGADAARRIREAQYTLTIPAAAGGAPSALARRLVYGNLDTRLSALEELGKGGKHAVPILRDFLADPESMVREAAVDALAATGDLRVVSLIDEQIKTEPDTNVIHAALRGLGGIRSKRGLALLAEFTTSESEDLAVAALEGIERLRTTQASEAVIKALDDPRWRVRAAALETVGKVELGDAAEKVRKLLGDEDSFVRYSALQAIVEMGDKGAAAELTKLYESAPDLRGPILEAIGRLSLPLPAAIKSSLASESNPDTLIAAVGELPGTGADGIRLTAEFLQHENLDVACAAGRSLASQSLKHPEARGALVAALGGGNEKMANAILENVSIGYDLRQMLRKLIRPVAFSLDPAAPAESTALDPLYNAFLDAAQGSAPGGEGESPDPAAVTSADVFESFLGVAQPGESEPAPGEKPESSSLPGFIAALEAFLAPDAAQHLRYRAALLLAAAGNGSAAEFLSADLDQRTVEQRAEIADSLDGLPSEKILPLLRILLQDPAESVRKNAAYACMAHAESSPAFADAAFEELVRLDSNLQPTELYNYRISSALNSRNGRRTFARWAKELVGRHSAESLQVMGLILLEQTWAKGDADLVKPFLTAESPWLRRAAFYAFGKNDEAAFREHIPALTADTSEHVRAVLAGIYGGDNSDWTHYFSRDSLASNQSSSYSSRRRRLPEEAEKALADLAANDPSPKVRVESAFTLIANSREIDLCQFVTTINALPDRKAIADRVADFLSENFRSLGTGFRVLLPVLDASSGRIGNLDEIYAHFGLDSSDEDGEIVYVSREEESAPVPASFLAPLAGDAVAAAAGAIKLLYFYSPGCAECARVDDYLDQLRSAFPRLEVERHNIRDPDAMRVNEALCARYGVAEKIRLVAPAVFSHSGCLIKTDIDFVALGKLVSRAAASAAPDGWDRIASSDLATAGATINDRYAALNVGVIAAAGLLDGINPCAFATIIFFLSYLQIARRSPREIAFVGIAFIAGVFAAYFLLGLGLIEVVARLQVHSAFRLAFNWLLAGVALVIMVLSLRDGVLCLQGRLADTALQLPGFLKDRIRSVSRTGARHSRFVIAAFVSGVIISFLELACTGQVYAPTIGFMLQSGRSSAMFYLLLYNIAFIIPLAIIFALSYAGMTSETLVRLQKRHTAAVKFATAALFLVLFLFLAFGDRLLAAFRG